MIWKDFFFFSGAQRSGIIVLFVLIAISFAFNKLLPVFIPDKMPVVDDSAFLQELGLFQASLHRTDSLRKSTWNYSNDSVGRRWNSNDKTWYDRNNSYRSRQHELTASTFQSNGQPTLFPFDPNTLDSTGLCQLGIPQRVVTAILRYRRKGGMFYTPERFSEMYGLSPDLYKLLEPYIKIDLPRVTDVHPDVIKTELSKPLELNSADSSQLMEVKGLNRTVVRSILRFRTASGGFVTIGQLRELYGMTEDMYSTISRQLTVDSTAINKIKVNTASVDKLRSHPYLDFYQAKAIYEYRRRKGKLKKHQELTVLDELDPETLQKMEDYFSYE